MVSADEALDNSLELQQEGEEAEDSAMAIDVRGE